MKHILLLLIVFLSFFIATELRAQCGSPMAGGIGETCANPASACLNGLISNNYGFSGAGGVDIPGCLTIQNDVYISFTVDPAFAGGSINFQIDLAGCTGGGNGLQAAIYPIGACNSTPLDCNQGSPVSFSIGGNVSFVPGNTYILMLDGVSGSQCGYTITANPTNSIVPPPDVFNGLAIGPMSPANAIISCADPVPDLPIKYSIPPVACATTYHWYIMGSSGSGGTASIMGIGIAANTSQSGMNINTTGTTGAAVNLSISGNTAGTFKLCVEAGNGCNYTPPLCKDVTIKTPPVDTSAVLYFCPNVSSWNGTGRLPTPRFPATLPGAPFSITTSFPGSNLYTVQVKDAQNCPFNVDLDLRKYSEADYSRDLGEIPLCKNQTVTICGTAYSQATPGGKVVICPVPAGSLPPKCDTTKSFFITPIIINPIIIPASVTKACPNSVVRLSGATSTWLPNLGGNQIVTYTWFKGAAIIPGATDSFYNVPAGDVLTGSQVYMFVITYKYNYFGPDGTTPLTKTCTEMTTATVSASVAPSPQTPVITGAGSYCNGGTYTFTISNYNGTDIIAWKINGVTVPNNITNSVTFQVSAPNDVITAVASNQCGSASAVGTLTINIQNSVAAPIIGGQDTVCRASVQSYCITNPDPLGTYTWQLPAGVTSVAGPGANCITATIGASAVSGDSVCVTAVDNCGTKRTCKGLIIKNVPAAPTLINGSKVVCSGDTITYSTPAIAEASQYVWTVTGGTINAGQNSGTIKVIWGVNTVGKVCVKSKNTCGNSADFCENIVIGMPPVPPVLFGKSTACLGEVVIYKVDTLRNGVTYTWTVTGGGTIIPFPTSDSIKVNWTNPGVSEKVCVKATNFCGSVDVCVLVVVNAIPVANAGVALDTVCGFQYNLVGTKNIPASDLLWTVKSKPAGSSVIFGNATSAATAVTVDKCGSYIFQLKENNNGCLDSAVTTVIFSEPPVINQLLATCAGNKLTYVVTFSINGCSAPFTVTGMTGGAVVGNNFTSNSIPSGTINYSYSVKDAYGCEVLAQGLKNCQCITNAGTMSATQLEACESGTVAGVFVGGFANDGNDVQQFALHNGFFASTNQAFAINNTGIFGFAAPMQYETTYYISSIAGNNKGGGIVDTTDNCLSVSPGQPVIFHKNPTPKAGMKDSICGKTFTFAAIKDVAGAVGTWTLLSGAGSVVSYTPDANTPTAEVKVTAFGNYKFKWEENNSGCKGSDSVAVTFLPDDLDAVHVSYLCDLPGEFYQDSIKITGGTPPFTILDKRTGLTYIYSDLSNFYETPKVPTSTRDTFLITDFYGCKTDTVKTFKVCDCKTEVVSVSILNPILCELDMVRGKGVGTKDNNDIDEYYLSATADPVSDGKLAINKTGTFSLLAGMNCGTTYYLSYAIGNADTALANIGHVNFTDDPCASIKTIPFIFNCQPIVYAGLDDTICDVNYVLQGTINIGKGTWRVISKPTNGVATFSNPNFKNSNVSVDSCGEYELEWRGDNNGCVDIDSVKITFGKVPIVGHTTAQNQSHTGFSVTLSINGCNQPFRVNTSVIAGSVYTSGILGCSPDSMSHYSFEVQDKYGCTASVVDSIACVCTSDAGVLLVGSLLSVCQSDSIRIAPLLQPNTGAMDPNDQMEYILSDKCGVHGAVIYQRNKSGKFVYQAPLVLGTTYFAYKIVGDSTPSSQVNITDLCLDSTACQSVRFIENPIPKAGGDDSICGLTYVLRAIPSVGTGVWRQVTGAGTSIFNDNTLAGATVSVSVCGVYTYEWKEDNLSCIKSDTVKIIFSEPPTVSNLKDSCNNIYTGYFVKFNLQGCGSPYKIVGTNNTNVTTVAGNFVSPLIPADSLNYKFTITDIYGCKKIITGTKNCICVGTFAGTFGGAIIKQCVDATGGGTISVSANLPSVKLDANDGIEYILTDSCLSPRRVGNVISRNKTGTFGFSGGMIYGKTYYIALVVGDTLLNGQVKLDTTMNRCLDVRCQPVVFYQCPNTLCQPNDTVACTKTYKLSTTPSFGTGKWEIKSRPIGSGANFVPSVNVPSPTVTVTTYGAYSFNWIEDNNGFKDTCTVSILFQFNPAPSIIASTLDTICNATDTTYTVTFSLSGVAPYSIKQALSNPNPAGTFSNGGAGNKFTSASIKSDLGYRFVFKDAISCDSTVVQGINSCPCKAEAGVARPALTVCERTDSTVILANLLNNEEPNGIWSLVPPAPDPDVSTGKFKTKNRAAGTYKFLYRIADKVSAPSCKGDSAYVTVVINPLPVADAGLDKYLNCDVTKATLGGANTSVGSEFSYQWTGALSNPSVANPIADGSGTYILTVRDVNTGCFTRDTVKVDQKISFPEITVSVKDPTCYGFDNGNIVIKSIFGGTKPYKFNFNGTGFVTVPKTIDTIPFYYLKAGKYTFAVLDSNGCRFDTILNIKEQPQLIADLGPDVVIDLGNDTLLKAIINIPFSEIDTIIWIPVKADTVMSLQYMVKVPQDELDYCITVISKNGCQATDCLRLRVDKKRPVFIPNIFSPDNNGLNDIFYIFGNPLVVKQIDNFEIYNRWGDVVFRLNGPFQPNDPQYGWDGTFNGKPMNNGVYVVWARVTYIDGKVELIKTDVTLHRN